LGKVLFVTSFKGGVGKTTVSAGIAAALSALGKRVCVIDADFGMRCMDLVLGMEDRVLYDCSDVLFGRCASEDAIVRVTEQEEFWFLPAPIRYGGEPFPHGSVEKLFSQLRARFDFCIVDSSAELSDYYRRFARQTDEAIVVSLHQSTAVRAAEKTAANLASLGHTRVRLVVNSYRAKHARQGTLPTVLEMIRRSSVPLIGVVPLAKELPAKQEAGLLAFCGKPYRRLLPHEAAFLNIALRLCGASVPLLQDVEKPARKKKAFKNALALL